MREQKNGLYLDTPEPQRSTLLVLRNIILEYDSNISETVKYGMPCFLYRKNILCYLWTEKKTGDPYILMAEGDLLNNPQLEKGDRTRMKILRIDPNADIPVKAIHSVLDEAITLYRKGLVRLK